MSKRRIARECALQTLYYSDTATLSLNEASLFANNFYNQLEKDTFPFCKDLVIGTIKNIKDIDKLLSSYTANWSVERMSLVDRSILRMAIYEIVYSTDKTPIPAIIDEAIELAKKYSTEKSSKFINGILDKVKVERKNG